ncbi:helix-turn-helix domain-containing protein [Aureisphaera galaxeae]|uniref:helix-turn-helix domain-containing protein n=1 Tax=Aureisphaera galaxeae TaxID=1538023 RepID=UPI0023503758|nr:helix-turn-helix domain-containing protein [Aureisphaera galaxeae]MDC8005767.1 helix-turn-helix domain-containing protein [Aureisphaera galaxeae]
MNKLLYIPFLVFVCLMGSALQAQVEYPSYYLGQSYDSLIAALWEGGTAWLLTLLLIIGFLGFYYFRKQRIQRKRFKDIVSDTPEQLPIPRSVNNKSKVSEALSEQILKKLDAFEKKKGYLNSSINMQNLAKRLGTNASYLSKVINSEKNKNFARYLNDLRIEHAAKWLREDEKARNYTIKAIALDCGYNNAESFSRAFYKTYGIHPSFFIKQLNKK